MTKVIGTAKVNKPFTVVVTRTNAVDSHDMVQYIVVLSHLRVQIAHHHYNISTRCLIIDSRVECKNRPFRYYRPVRWGITMYDGDITYSTTETSGYKSFRYGFP